MGDEIRSHRDLRAWKAAFEAGLRVYEATRQFPGDERYGLTPQLRRAAVSIASNIAEGYGRGRTSDYLRFLRIARGSAYEVDTQLCFALQFGYLSQGQFDELMAKLNDAGRLLAGLIRSLETGDAGPRA